MMMMSLSLRYAMSSLSTAFKVHYNQKMETHPAVLGGTHHGLWGIDAPENGCAYWRHFVPKVGDVIFLLHFFSLRGPTVYCL